MAHSMNAYPYTGEKTVWPRIKLEQTLIPSEL
ncbi:uncharacterized protein G2W53_039443 [Senna tora]|uniref:Uncharacterized protein n=1 Tax=Senna tora TaxID=362788 RepID=A0A834SP56_9FABA|nr:uncharacterized protein G2W53_039443 [Senna tora]